MNITFVALDNNVVSLNVRVIPGVPPKGAAPVYEVLDQNGKPKVLNYDITVDKERHTGFYDCVEVENGDVFAYRWLGNQRAFKIGRVADL